MQAAGADFTPFTLAEAIERVQVVAPQRRAAQAHAQAATGALHQASRLPNPSLDIRQENLGAGRRLPIDQTIDVFAVVSQPVEIGGKRAARTAVAADEVAAARSAIRQTERSLTLETVRLYLAALQAHLRTEFLLNNRNELQPLVAMMNKRVAEGYAAEADLMKFRTEAARLDTQITRASLEFNQATTMLAALLDFAEPLTGARLALPSPLAPPSGDPSALAQQAVERLPEIISARAQLARAQHALDLEKARRLPDPIFIVGYKRTGGEDTLITGVMAPLPMFDQNAGNIERAVADKQAAALALEALLKQEREATVVLLQSAQELSERARLVDQQLLQPAAIVRNAARSSFREGAANILQLVDAERVYTETQREALELKLEAYAKSFASHLLLQEDGQP